MCGKFFWGSKVHKIAWEHLIGPKIEDEIGLRLLKDLKTTTLLKLTQNLLTKDYLWTNGQGINIYIIRDFG